MQERDGFCMRAALGLPCEAPPHQPPDPSLWHLHKYELSGQNSRTKTAHSLAVIFFAKNVYSYYKIKMQIDIAIKHIKTLLKFFKACKISGFENWGNMIKQIFTGLEIEIKMKDCQTQQKHPIFIWSFKWNNY